MQNLIQLDEYPVKDALHILLQDKTTGKNIIFATEAYSELGEKLSSYIDTFKRSHADENAEH
ncbi:MAG: hypothetical protein J6O04_04280 [Selenomonadaceae bacterium]|nr:hypothetical protein [Selenomonadaceae bacterium]